MKLHLEQLEPRYMACGDPMADVTGDGIVSPADVIQIVNALNAESGTNYRPVDALRAVNVINRDGAGAPVCRPPLSVSLEDEPDTVDPSLVAVATLYVAIPAGRGWTQEFRFFVQPGVSNVSLQSRTAEIQAEHTAAGQYDARLELLGNKQWKIVADISPDLSGQQISIGVSWVDSTGMLHLLTSRLVTVV